MRDTSDAVSSWLDARAGLGSMVVRLAERSCRIAYLGASVTAQSNGYPTHLHAGLCARSGREHLAVRAGIGGVGATTGVFLMDELVLAHRPDLCFVEFATGDSASDRNLLRLGAVAEGVIRKLRANDCAVVILHGYRAEGGGPARLESAVRQWEEVAEHYGVPSLHLYRWVAEQVAADPGCEPEWFRDVVHTTPVGARALADTIFDGLRNLQSPGIPALPSRLHADCFAATRLVPVDAAMAEDAQAVTTGMFRLFYRWVGVECGNAVSIESDDDVVGLLVVVGPDAGIVEIRSERGVETVSAFDEWCHYDRLHALIFAGPAPLHRVQVALVERAVDYSVCRQPVAAVATKRLRAIAWLVRSACAA